MQIIIHTLGRSKFELQHTLQTLLECEILPTLVVQEHEADEYQWYEGPVYILPPRIKRLAETRDYIIHDMPGPDHVVFLDDDLRFAARREDDRTKFRPASQADIHAMFKMIDHQLDCYAMVGIGAREGGNRNTEEFLYNTRIMRVLGFSRNYLKKHHITFSPLVVMEDFHVNLQILRTGAPTCVCNMWVSDQVGGSDAPGGCSAYRTAEVQTESAHLLASRHPGFVKVVKKKGWQGQGERTDVIIQWKQAYAAGQRNL